MRRIRTGPPFSKSLPRGLRESRFAQHGDLDFAGVRELLLEGGGDVAADFGRRAVMTARQTLLQKVKDLERDIIYEKYKDLIGEIISAEVYQVLSREVLLVDGEGNEIVLPKSEQIQKDRFRKGESIRAVVARVDLA